MHGVIFTTFRAFASSEYPSVSDRILEGRRFLSTQAYDDAEFEAVVARTVELTGDTRETVLRRFGIFAGVSTFRLLYPAYYAAHTDTFEFLLDIEEQIHEVVRRTIPQAAPPRLDITALSDGRVSITYTSSRQLCELLEGLVMGVGRHYGDSLRIEQPLCMHRGDSAGCNFLVSRNTPLDAP